MNLETPCILVDIDILNKNIKKMAKNSKKVRSIIAVTYKKP